MSRWKAAGIHITLSLLIGLIVFVLLFGVWYPPPYFRASGADELMLLVVGVDVVLGPLLTLIVFKSGKKGLKFDLGLIAVMQSIALVYGLSVMLRSRPVFLVAAVDRFSVVSASDIDASDLAAGPKPEFRSLSWTGPRVVGAEVPSEKTDRLATAMSAMAGKDIDHMPRYFVDYADAARGILDHAKPIDALKTNDDVERAALDEAVRKTGLSRDALVWVPLMARKANLTMLLDAKTGAPVRPVAVNPWVH
jgi:hypothetical protein